MYPKKPDHSFNGDLITTEERDLLNEQHNQFTQEIKKRAEVERLAKFLYKQFMHSEVGKKLNGWVDCIPLAKAISKEFTEGLE
jgi:hypothetical protein